MKYLFFLFISCTLLCTSCSPYQVVLKGTDSVAKYQMADSLYHVAMATGKKGKFRSSLKLMEQIVPLFRGKPQAEKLSYIYANTFFNLGDFFVSGYQFERFESTYPKSDSVEVAAYKSAKSYYELSPNYSLDQKDTEKGMEKLQAFVNKYPNSTFRIEANDLVSELREKVERKDIEKAHQYFKIGQQIGSFKPAVDAYENFISDHPGSVFREVAFYGRVEASYNRAITSIPAVQKERLIISKDYYSKYLKYYKAGDKKEDADALIAAIDKRLEKYQVTTEN
ncbi:MAG: outer membrane protein assembly factor BamD [Saprospiraceae bacterium]|jgi:outer membrane protein assembly factor BamD